MKRTIKSLQEQYLHFKIISGILTKGYVVEHPSGLRACVPNLEYAEKFINEFSQNKTNPSYWSNSKKIVSATETEEGDFRTVIGVLECGHQHIIKSHKINGYTAEWLLERKTRHCPTCAVNS